MEAPIAIGNPSNIEKTHIPAVLEYRAPVTLFVGAPDNAMSTRRIQSPSGDTDHFTQPSYMSMGTGELYMLMADRFTSLEDGVVFFLGDGWVMGKLV